MIILTISCYATASAFGFKATTDLFSFGFVGEGSILSTLKLVIEYGINSTEMILTLVQCIMHLLAIVAVLIIIVITLVKSIIDVIKGNNKGLIKNNILMLIGNCVVITVFSVFGEYAEGVGLGAGTGLIAGTVITFLALVTLGVVNFIFNRKAILKTHTADNLCYLLVLVVLYFLVFTVAANLRLYSPLMLAVFGNSSTTDYIGGYLVFLCGTALVIDSLQYGVNALTYVATLDENSDFEKFRSKRSNRGANFITGVCFGVIAIIAAFIGGFPSHYTVLTIVSTVFAIIGLVGWILFDKMKLFEKNKKAEVTAEANSETTDTTDANK